MARKRKKKVFSAAKMVREMARERVGSPKPSQSGARERRRSRRGTNRRWASCSRTSSRVSRILIRKMHSRQYRQWVW